MLYYIFNSDVNYFDNPKNKTLRQWILRHFNTSLQGSFDLSWAQERFFSFQSDQEVKRLFLISPTNDKNDPKAQICYVNNIEYLDSDKNLKRIYAEVDSFYDINIDDIGGKLKRTNNWLLFEGKYHKNLLALEGINLPKLDFEKVVTLDYYKQKDISFQIRDKAIRLERDYLIKDNNFIRKPLQYSLDFLERIEDLQTREMLEAQEENFWFWQNNQRVPDSIINHFKNNQSFQRYSVSDQEIINFINRWYDRWIFWLPTSTSTFIVISEKKVVAINFLFTKRTYNEGNPPNHRLVERNTIDYSEQSIASEEWSDLIFWKSLAIVGLPEIKGAFVSWLKEKAHLNLEPTFNTYNDVKTFIEEKFKSNANGFLYKPTQELIIDFNNLEPLMNKEWTTLTFSKKHKIALSKEFVEYQVISPNCTMIIDYEQVVAKENFNDSIRFRYSEIETQEAGYCILEVEGQDFRQVQSYLKNDVLITNAYKSHLDANWLSHQFSSQSLQIAKQRADNDFLLNTIKNAIALPFSAISSFGSTFQGGSVVAGLNAIGGVINTGFNFASSIIGGLRAQEDAQRAIEGFNATYKDLQSQERFLSNNTSLTSLLINKENEIALYIAKPVEKDLYALNRYFQDFGQSVNDYYSYSLYNINEALKFSIYGLYNQFEYIEDIPNVSWEVNNYIKDLAKTGFWIKKYD
ncbi:P81 [Mycoplasma phage P1]|uniref:P81 n=1 Tax=Mycoplasma phage P1 TaxID=2905920 RepID=Q9FZR2_9CAUD|nr:P81 [Mycoplasma phage P1]AAG01282.1 P81 [Mycoplasma phage P1]